jgi:hypothetical protein
VNHIVQQLYEHGATGQLIETAQGAGIFTDDCAGAREALRLLARLGDPDAATFCATFGAAAPDACSPAATAH